MGRAIRKYGWQNVFKQVVASGITEKEACNFEKLLISLLKTNKRENGYNNTSGGEPNSANRHMSEDARKKMSVAKRQLWERVTHPWVGRHHTEETKEKIRSSKQGRCCGESNAFYGHHHSQEVRDRLSQERKGKGSGGNNPRAIPVVCVETGIKYACAKDAAKALGINHGSICSAAKGKLNTAGHLHWKYD